MPKVRGNKDLTQVSAQRGTVALGSKIRQRLTAYIASAAHHAPDILTVAAIGTVALAGQSAEAGIIVNNTPINIPLPALSHCNSQSCFGKITIPWSFDGGNKFNFLNHTNLGFRFDDEVLSLRAVSGNGFLRGPLAKGVEIGPEGLFTGVSEMAGAGFYNGLSNYEGLWFNKSGYLGFEFTDSTGLHFGWAYLSLNPDTTSGVLSEFAYDTDPGQAIAAGQTSTPEPGTLGLLALGFLGLGLWRRKAVHVKQ